MYILITALFSLLLINNADCHHILISAATQSFGQWNQLLHISKELLSRTNENGSSTNFITFMIEENHKHYLDTIHTQRYNPYSYQVLYTPSEPQIDAVKLRDANLMTRMKEFGRFIIDGSFVSQAILTAYLSHSQSHDVATNASAFFLNEDLKHEHNSAISIQFEPVDVCLLCPLHIFAIHLCKALKITTILRHENAGVPQAESSNFWDTYLYYNDMVRFDRYPDLINGSVFTSYSQRMQNVMQQWVSKYGQKTIGRFVIKPKMEALNTKLQLLNQSVDLSPYNDGIFGIWRDVALIHSLGPPFATVFYQRPRIKPFGFLLYPSEALIDDELNTWINKDDTAILYISMGSVHLLPENALRHIYHDLMKHSLDNGYRVLWALRQTIYDNTTNDALHKSHFKIAKWVAQLAILQHPNVKAFFSHSGGNGIVEGLYSKTPMILYPRGGDQYFNARRTEELECGRVIQDREQLTDLVAHVEMLLIDANTSLHYRRNVEKVHKMLLQNGGVKDAADFIEHSAEFGIGHLLCTLGHKYPCDERHVPWYQQTITDIYCIIIVLMALLAYCVKMCCCRTKIFASFDSKHKTE